MFHNEDIHKKTPATFSNTCNQFDFEYHYFLIINNICLILLKISVSKSNKGFSLKIAKPENRNVLQLRKFCRNPISYMHQSFISLL